MESSLLRQLQREVERQCSFAMIALQDMEEASANSDGRLFWYSVQGLLVSVERISLILWPSGSRSTEQAAEVRRSLDVDENSPLKDRTFLNRFACFDEQIEEWHETSEQRRFFDSYTEPLDVLAETKPGDRFRGYDMEKNALLFHQKAYYLDPVSRAIEELHQRAEAETQKPRFDLGR